MEDMGDRKDMEACKIIMAYVHTYVCIKTHDNT